MYVCSVANTNELKTRIEPFVREWLGHKFGTTFRCDFLQLQGCEGSHEFDAVSDDNTIVAGIKSSSGATSGGRTPAGKIASAFQEIYYLSLVQGRTKLLVLTDQQFYQLMLRKTQGKVPSTIQLLYCALPVELEELARSIRITATDEMDHGKAAFAKKATR